MASTNLRAWVSAILQEVTGIEPNASYECISAPHDLTELYHSTGDLLSISTIVVCSEYSLEFADQLERAKYTGDHRALAVFKPSFQDGLTLLLSTISSGVQPEITFIPIGINRYISRGFNQTHVLARMLEKTH